MLLQCAPGANFKPVLDMLDKVLMYRKLAEGAAATANGAKPAPGKQQQHQKPAQHAQRPAPAQQQKVGCGWLIHMLAHSMSTIEQLRVAQLQEGWQCDCMATLTCKESVLQSGTKTVGSVSV